MIRRSAFRKSVGVVRLGDGDRRGECASGVSDGRTDSEGGGLIWRDGTLRRAHMSGGQRWWAILRT